MSIEAINLTQLELFDHHCHGVLTDSVDREAFEALISESSRPASNGTTRFDSQVGFQVRAHCAPLLGLERFCEPDDYIVRRNELGAAEVNRRFLQAADIRTYAIETGHGADVIYSPDQMADITGTHAHEIVRLERIVEQIIDAHRDASAQEMVSELEQELDRRLTTAIGVKSIAAYRIGFDFDHTRPSEDEVRSAVQSMLTQQSPARLADPVLIRHMIWLSIDRACVIQFHVGYGDDDVNLDRCNPLLLTELLRASVDTGAQFTLLHCYPYHREAGYLADVFPHVYFDVGLGINYTGSRSAEILAESLELAPFGKVLFSSDAWGAPELFYLGAYLFRRGLAQVLETFRIRDGWPVAECERVAELIGYENAARVYGVDDRSDA